MDHNMEHKMDDFYQFLQKNKSLLKQIVIQASMLDILPESNKPSRLHLTSTIRERLFEIPNQLIYVDEVGHDYIFRESKISFKSQKKCLQPRKTNKSNKIIIKNFRGDNNTEDSESIIASLGEQIDADYFLISDSVHKALCVVEKSKMNFHTNSKSSNIQGDFNYDDAYWIFKPEEITLNSNEISKCIKIAKKCEANHNKYIETQINTLKEKTFLKKFSAGNV